MRQILIVHSSIDRRFEQFFERIFSTVEVKTVWETYEGIARNQDAKKLIQNEILESDALFFVISTDAEFASLAKAWFPWATDLAKDKDIWVFEHCEDLKRIQVPVPGLNHYSAFYITNAWSDYVTKIAESYEKPKGTSVPLPEGVLKPLSSAEVDAFFNSSTGLALFDDSTARPVGMKVVCPNCSSGYGLHLPSEMKIVRCPSCGHFYGIQQTVKVHPAPNG